MIGHLLVQALRGEVDREVVALLTQVVVAADDPAFARPTKPIGPVYEQAEAHRLAAERGWTSPPTAPAFGESFRHRSREQLSSSSAIENLAASGAIVVCAGGGGIPVVVDRRHLLAASKQ